MQSYYRIPLEDLLRRGLNIQWFEGVAIVQGACRQILADGSRGFPAPAEVFVCTQGTVEVGGTAPQSESVAAAGHALNQMLTEDAPVRLRLVASQATAAGYETLRQFSDDIAYFERPDPEGILRNLHHRFWDAEFGDEAPPDVPQEIDQDVPQKVAARPQPELKPEEPQPAKTGRRNRLVLACAALVVLCALCAAVWRLPTGPKGAAASAVAATVENAVRSTLALVTPAKPAEKTAVEPENKVLKIPPARRASRRRSVEAPGKNAEGRTGQNVSTLRGTTMSQLPPVRPVPMIMWSRPEVPEDVVPEGPQAPTLYSVLNSEVVPPKSVYPKLPAAPPSGFSLPGVTVLEMVIGTDGVVERVRLRTDPRNIHEFMLVSAAKAWQFEPARLRGTPVRYLHTVVLTLQ